MNTRRFPQAAFCAFLLLASLPALAADWPQWRGPQRDGHTAPGALSIDKLPESPKVVWRLDIGGGFSSPVVEGRFLAYCDENGTDEVVHVVDSANGRELWKQPLAPRYTDEWGAGTRSTPILDGPRVYALSCSGELRCFELESGKIIWGLSFDRDFQVRFLGSKAREGTASRRGNNGTPVVEGPHLIVPVGNTNGAAVVCVDKLTGKQIWKTGDEEAAYSSLMVATLAGKKQVVAFMADSLMGIDRDSGKILWREPLVTNAKRHTMTPVISGDTITVNSHTFGMICFKISKSSDGCTVSRLWSNPATKINLATPVLVNGYLYSHGPNKDFVCVDAKTGLLKWSQTGFGKENSSTLTNGKKLLVLTDDGQLVMLGTDPARGYDELGRVQVCGKNWNFPACVGNRLFVRDQRELICYDLAAK